MLARVDRSQLASALINLCSNARDAMAGAGRLEIHVKPVMTEGTIYAEIAVNDVGCGMTSDQVEKSCDLFFTTKDDGTGLGLSMVRKFVNRAGGRMAIVSRPGEGTSVRLCLPIATERSDPLSDKLRLRQRPMVEGLRVMVVDDKASVVTSVTTLLADLGCAVSSFLNPEEARDALQTGRATPDVVLSDIRMRGKLDGRGLAQWISRERPQIAVILMTGYAGEEVDDFMLLRKPFATDELFSLLTRVIEQKQSDRRRPAARAS